MLNQLVSEASKFNESYLGMTSVKQLIDLSESQEASSSSLDYNSNHGPRNRNTNRQYRRGYDIVLRLWTSSRYKGRIA